MKLIGKTSAPRKAWVVASRSLTTRKRRRMAGSRNDCVLGRFGVGHRVVAVAEEADVVELDLVEALVRQVARDGGDVLGHAGVERVEPDAAPEVMPRAAGGRVAHRQLGSRLPDRVVLHDHHPRDGVDAALLEPRQQLLQLEDRSPIRAGALRLRQVRLVVQVAARLLHVDDHGVGLGPIDQAQHVVQAPGALEHGPRRVQRARLEGLQRHVLGG